MPTENVSLSEQQAQFIRERVGTGGYSDASEVVRAALRLLQQQEQHDQLKLQKLRRLVDESDEQFQRGQYTVVGPDEIDQFMNEIDAKVRGAKQCDLKFISRRLRSATLKRH